MLSSDSATGPPRRRADPRRHGPGRRSPLRRHRHRAAHRHGPAPRHCPPSTRSPLVPLKRTRYLSKCLGTGTAARAARSPVRIRWTAMDEFARMMGMEGVRPLDQMPKSSGRLARKAQQARATDPVPKPETAPMGHAWVNGSRARTALETALERLDTEIRDGRRGWATGIRQDGTTVSLPTTSGAASLLGSADRQSQTRSRSSESRAASRAPRARAMRSSSSSPPWATPPTNSWTSR